MITTMIATMKTAMTTTMMIDIAFCGLFALGFLYCLVAERRLARLHQDRQDVDVLLASLSESTEKGREQIKVLDAHIKSLEKAWEDILNKGDVLRGDLHYCHDRGESLLHDLDTKIKELKAVKRSSHASHAAAQKGVSLLNPKMVASHDDEHYERLAG